MTDETKWAAFKASFWPVLIVTSPIFLAVILAVVIGLYACGVIPAPPAPTYDCTASSPGHSVCVERR